MPSRKLGKFFFILKNKEIKITNFFLSQVVIITSTMLIIAAFFWINDKNKSIKAEVTRSQVEYLNVQKELIKRETKHAIDNINYSIKKSEETLKNKIRFRVNLAHSIATNIYQKNAGKKSNSEISELIKDALRPIQFKNETTYIFIANTNGVDILFPVAPELEGKNIINFQDEYGNYIVQEEINIAKTKGEGFAISYWKHPRIDTSVAQKKLSYIKLFEPFNWYIGTGEFFSDYTKSIKEEVIANLANYRFGEDGYIFINTYDGDALILNGEAVKGKINIWDVEDPNGVKIVQEERKVVKNLDGGYIYYSWNKLADSIITPKMSFLKGVPEWQWMVGAGVYIEDINTHLAAKEKELKNQILRDSVFIAIVIIIIFALLSLAVIYTSNRLKKNISWFIKFFESATDNYELIDKSKITYSEFYTIAEYANNMISKLKVSELKKQEEEAHYEKLFDESHEAIAFVNSEGKVQKINTAFKNLFGFDISEIQNKNIDEVNVPKELKKEAISYTKQFKDGSYGEIEAVRLNKNFQKIYVSITGTPVSVNQKLLGFYIIYRNITKQKEFEQKLYDSKTKAEESDRLKTSFLTNLSHEIRTPLNAIIGFSTLLNTKNINQKDQKEYLQILGNSGKLLLEIIDKIIDISKIESSTLIVNKTNCNLNTFLDELYIDYIDYRNNMNFENIELKLNKEIEEKELVVFTDLKRIKQVFTNLLDNAFKFTEYGEVKFGYHIEKDKIICFVKDTGIGIKENDLQFIFDRFRQVDESTTRKYGGTGIGLALCKSLIELLGGDLWVESKKNQGSSFYFNIPYNSIKSVKREHPKQKSFDHIDWSDKKILIAEDVETNY